MSHTAGTPAAAAAAAAAESVVGVRIVPGHSSGTLRGPRSCRLGPRKPGLCGHNAANEGPYIWGWRDRAGVLRHNTGAAKARLRTHTHTHTYTHTCKRTRMHSYTHAKHTHTQAHTQSSSSSRCSTSSLLHLQAGPSPRLRPGTSSCASASDLAAMPPPPSLSVPLPPSSSLRKATAASPAASSTPPGPASAGAPSASAPRNPSSATLLPACGWSSHGSCCRRRCCCRACGARTHVHGHSRGLCILLLSDTPVASHKGRARTCARSRSAHMCRVTKPAHAQDHEARTCAGSLIQGHKSGSR